MTRLNFDMDLLHAGLNVSVKGERQLELPLSRRRAA